MRICNHRPNLPRVHQVNDHSSVSFLLRWGTNNEVWFLVYSNATEHLPSSIFSVGDTIYVRKLGAP